MANGNGQHGDVREVEFGDHSLMELTQHEIAGGAEEDFDDEGRPTHASTASASAAINSGTLTDDKAQLMGAAAAYMSSELLALSTYLTLCIVGCNTKRLEAMNEYVFSLEEQLATKRQLLIEQICGSLAESAADGSATFTGEEQ